MLKPQDVLVLLKLISKGDQPWTNSSLAKELGISSGEVYNSLERSAFARLYDRQHRHVRSTLLEEFIVHGVPYAFPVQRGELTRGIPTSHAASPLVEILKNSQLNWPPVWPDPNGPVRGYALMPLYRSVPIAARADSRLYELLALVDAIREGRPREKDLAIRELHNRLQEGTSFRYA